MLVALRTNQSRYPEQQTEKKETQMSTRYLSALFRIRSPVAFQTGKIRSLSRISVNFVIVNRFLKIKLLQTQKKYRELLCTLGYECWGFHLCDPSFSTSNHMTDDTPTTKSAHKPRGLFLAMFESPSVIVVFERPPPPFP